MADVTGYSDGRKLEYEVIRVLTADGYWCIRAAGSKGAADVVAIKAPPVAGMHTEILLVQCKISGDLRLAERIGLSTLARKFHGTAVLARWAKDGRAARYPEFREITGPGPDDWRPWTADYAMEGNP